MHQILKNGTEHDIFDEQHQRTNASLNVVKTEENALKY